MWKVFLKNQQQWDEYFMQIALDEAKIAFDKQEVPVGAVLVQGNRVIAKAHNQVESLQDATAHAELICLREASSILKNWRLTHTTLYTTLEPCSMCLGAVLLSRVHRLVFGAKDKRHGACESWVNLLGVKHPTHTLEVERYVLEEQSAFLLKEFFKLRRIQNGKSF